MAHDDAAEQLRQMRREEIAKADPHWWYLSFATEEKFLGAAHVHAFGMIDAVAQTKALGINPGGAVMGHPISDDQLVPEHFRNRLVDRAALEAFFADKGGLVETKQGACVCGEERCE